MPRSDSSSLWSAVSATGKVLPAISLGRAPRCSLQRSGTGLLPERPRRRAARKISLDCHRGSALGCIGAPGAGWHRAPPVLWPADLAIEHLGFVMASANVDAIVSDGMDLGPEPRHRGFTSHALPSLCPRHGIAPPLTLRNGFCSPPAPPGGRKWCSIVSPVCAEQSKGKADWTALTSGARSTTFGAMAGCRSTCVPC